MLYSELKYAMFSFILIIILILSSYISMHIFLNTLLVLSVILLVFQIILYKSVLNKKFSIFVFYLISLYIFSFGQLYTSYTIYADDFNFEYTKFTSSTVINGFVYVFCFISISFFPALRGKKEKIIMCDANNTIINKVYAFLLLLFGLPFLLYQVYVKTTVMLESGYGTNLQLISGPVSLFSLFTYVGLFLIYYSYSNKYIKFTSLLLFIFLAIISMAGGNRSVGLVPLLFSMYMIYFDSKKFILKKILYLGIILYCALVALYIVTSVRGDKYNYSDITLSAVTAINPYKYSINLLYELGGTISNTFKVLDEIDIYFMPGYGKSYLFSVFGPIPNINGVLDFARNEVTYVKKFKSSKFAGGSCIAESFYNFKWLGLVVAYFLAKLVTKISILYEVWLKKGKYIQTSMLVIPTFSIIWLPRDYFTSIFTSGIFSVVILIFFYNITKRLLSVSLYKTSFPNNI